MDQNELSAEGLRYLNQILFEPEAAAECRMSVATMRRLGPAGPVRIRLSARRWAYRRSDLLAWLEARREPQRDWALRKRRKPPVAPRRRRSAVTELGAATP
jgi:hypothetical protein